MVVVRGGHEYILNSAALRKWNITKDTPEPAGGRITRYADGELNGELVDRAKRLVSLPPAQRSLEERIQDQIAEYDKLHAAGLTAVRHPGGSIEDYRMRREMQRRGVLTMRVTQLLNVGGGDPAAIEKTIKSWGIAPDDGDAMLRIGGIKLALTADSRAGSCASRTRSRTAKAASSAACRRFRRIATHAIVRTLNRLDWRVFTHAVGDAAIDEVLAGYEAANAEKSIVGRRWGIEHGFIPHADQFPRMKTLGLFVSAQNHLYLAGPSLVKYWGPETRGVDDAGEGVSRRRAFPCPAAPMPPSFRTRRSGSSTTS